MDDVCHYCNIYFTSLATLWEHIQSGHRDPFEEYRRDPDTPYPWHIVRPQCGTCGTLLYSEQDWHNHRCPQPVAVTHTYECLVCDRRFSSVVNRLLHQISVHNLRYYACETCPQQFEQLHELTHHQNTHMIDPNANPNNRHTQTTGDGAYRYHPGERATHSYGINDMETQPDIRQHSSTHPSMAGYPHKTAASGQREVPVVSNPTHAYPGASSTSCQFCCDVCRKAFTRKDNYERHMAKHNANNKHECADCGKVYSRPDNLKRHAVQHGAGEVAPFKQRRIGEPRDHYYISKTNVSHSEKFNTTASKYMVTFNDVEVNTLPEVLATFHQVLNSLIADITTSIPQNDLVQMNIQHPELDFPIAMPFMYRQNLDANFILTEIERVLQSFQEFTFDNTLEIHFTHVALPEGRGKFKCVNLDEYLEKKRCVIRIQNKDSLCCARAIVSGMSRIDQDDWDNIRKGRSAQKERALELHKNAGVPLGVCGLKEIKQFQAYLTGYQLNVVSKAHFNAVIYTGPECDKRIYIYHHDNHFDLITSMPAFLNRSYFCTVCNKPYANKKAHRCVDVCGCCFKNHYEAGDEEWIPCKLCNRVFKGTICFDLHSDLNAKGTSTCKNYSACKFCGKTLDAQKRRNHMCGEVLCKICNEYVMQGHQCFMKTVSENGRKKSASNEVKETDIGDASDARYIFYDFETMQDNDVHVPNLCVAHKVCGKCIDEETEHCTVCGDRQNIFYGPDSRDNFCNWLFSRENKGSTCIAHNAKGFDCYFIRKYLNEHCIIPDIIFNGAKVMSITVSQNKMRFIDSLNFIPSPLSQLPSAFGLSGVKGWFPHYFNTKDNQDRRFTHLPNQTYYNPQGMKKSERKQFEEWYEIHKSNEFDLKTEQIKYCVGDVDILRRCCLKFRNMFMAMTSLSRAEYGIDPFKTSITIASACNLVFRTHFLKPNTIAIIPPQGYHPEQKHSIKAMKWIKYVAYKENVRIEHAMNGKEFKIGNYPVDGYFEKDGVKTVLQFEGDLWHGCPRCYTRETINPINQKTMEELYTTTMQKKKYMEDLGYKYTQMWECDFEKSLKEDTDMKTFVDNLDIATSLNPREAFYGGRTEGFKLIHEAGPGETIEYLDFTSLYPSVNKYSKYPVGHPVIITENFDDLDKYEGLIKCKILPPRSLFLPVLPVKTNNKLLFALCRTCAETQQQDPCTHSDEQRAFVGTWVSEEVKKAVLKGYKILRMYEVWHFSETSQYDRETKSGGLFSGYVDKFLKMKQEASGWPEWCVSEEDKRTYIQDYLENEGISLDYDNIKKNPGLRSLTKIMLNSFWGRFGMRSSLCRTTHTDNPAVYFDHMTSSCIDVRSVQLVSDEVMEIQYVYKDDFLEPSAKSNVVIAAYTTAHARLKLYDLLDSLGQRILYTDTDSAIFVQTPDVYAPETGDFLGQLTREIENNEIVSVVTAGAKNYCYKLAKPNKDGDITCCKVRGITLNTANSELINFESIKRMVKGVGPEKLTVLNEHKITRDRKNSEIVNKVERKDYRVVFDKRVIRNGYNTVPYGY